MKTKNITKKLTLSKQVIAALNGSDLNKARGGTNFTAYCTGGCNTLVGCGTKNTYDTMICCTQP